MFKYPLLFKPQRVGHLVAQNRIVMPPMHTGLANAAGEVTADLLAYYQARALGGPGIMVVEIACVEAPRGRANLFQLRIDHPRFLPGLSRLAETLKMGQSLAFIQLHHAGRQTNTLFTEGVEPVAPSPVPCRFSRSNPRELTREEIQEIRDRFIEAAGYAKEAGFDGVELHAAHGYLLSQFLSPYTNRRDDEYGGDPERRTRLVREIIAGIKARFTALAVGVRFNMSDFLPQGIEPDEGLIIAKYLEEAGADYLSVSCGMYESGLVTTEPMSYQEGWRLYLAEMVKTKVGIPVIGGGVIRRPEAAEEALAQGKLDLVFVGRAHIADEEWTYKARRGESESIRPCLSCNQCINRSFQGLPISCTVNPKVGREARLPKTGPADKPRKFLVAGGGPAGMAVAAGLARQGHRVFLVEASDTLGGALKIAAKPPHKWRIGILKDYLERELKSSGVQLILGQSLKRELVEEIKPDVLIVATGAKPCSLPGVDNNEKVKQATDVLKQTEVPSGLEVVLIGGGMSGCETALYLSQRGNKVKIVEMKDELALDADPMNRLDLLLALKREGVELLTGFAVAGLDAKGVRVANKRGQDKVLPADLVVLSVGYEPQVPNLEEYLGLVSEIRVIGDARRPGRIGEALLDALWVTVVYGRR